jgi:hypothetical protein
VRYPNRAQGNLRLPFWALIAAWKPHIVLPRCLHYRYISYSRALYRLKSDHTVHPATEVITPPEKRPHHQRSDPTVWNVMHVSRASIKHIAGPRGLVHYHLHLYCYTLHSLQVQVPTTRHPIYNGRSSGITPNLAKLGRSRN